MSMSKNPTFFVAGPHSSLRRMLDTSTFFVIPRLESGSFLTRSIL